MIGWKTIGNFPSQWYYVKWCWKFCVETLKKVFLNAKKLASRKVFRHLLRANFFMFILLISNHTVFLIQFGINLHLWVFQKAEIALAEVAHAVSTFWKSHSCKLIPNWTRNRMITYTNQTQKTVFDKDREESWKYDTQRSIFGVWIADETLSRVFYISS